MINLVRILTWISSATIILTNSGCSGGGPTGNLSSERVVISGVAQAGPIDGKVTIYQLDSKGERITPALGTQENVKDGVFNIWVPKSEQPVIIAASGTYRDEATGALVDMQGQELSQIIANTKQSSQVPVTPATTFVADMVKEKIRKGELLRIDAEQAIEESHQKVSQLFGVDVKTLKAVPLPPEEMNVNSEGAKAALMLTSLSRAMKDSELSSDKGVNPVQAIKTLSANLAQKKDEEQQITGSDISNDPKLQTFGNNWASKLKEAQDKLANDKGLTLPADWTLPRSHIGKQTENYAPEALGDSLIVWDSTPDRGLMALDRNGDPLEFIITQFPSKGTIVLINKTRGIFQYVPDANQEKIYGSDTFMFAVFDGQKYSEPATVSFQRIPANGLYSATCFVDRKELSRLPDSTGYCSGDALYYIKGIPFPGLDSQGSGISKGVRYLNGKLANGLLDGEYYQDGQPGSGMFGGKYYQAGQLVARLELSASLLEFPELGLGNSNISTVTLKNTGDKEASSVRFFRPSSPAFSVINNQCQSTLAPQSDCIFEIKFSPTTLGAQNDMMEISFDNGWRGTGIAVASPSIQLMLNGIGEASYKTGLLLTDKINRFRFPDTRVFRSSSQRIEIVNPTAKQLTNVYLVHPKTTFQIFSTNCNWILEPRSSCYVDLLFFPNQEGVHTERLIIRYKLGNDLYSDPITLQGNGIPGAFLTLFANSESFSYSLNFPQTILFESSTTTFTLKNLGRSTATHLQLSSATLYRPPFLSSDSPFKFKGGVFPGLGGTCQDSLAPDQSCLIVMEYLPSQIGYDERELVFTYDDQSPGPTETRAYFSGYSYTPAQVEISDLNNLDFGSVEIGKTVEKTITVTHSAGSAYAFLLSTLNPPFSFKKNGYPFGGSCGEIIWPGTSCTMVIEFTPNLISLIDTELKIQVGSFIDDKIAGSEKNIVSHLTGRGLLKLIIKSSELPPFDFGLAKVGEIKEKTLTILNPTTITTALEKPSGITLPFSFKGGTYPGTGGTCSSKLEGKSSCTISLQYTPSQPGAFSNQVSVSSRMGSDVTQSNIVTVAGTAFIPLALRESLPYTFTASPNGQLVEKEFLLTNPSSADVSDLVISGLSAPFKFKHGSYPGAGGTCSSKLAPGESCTFVIAFEAAELGFYKSSAAITYKQNGVSLQSEWTGTGIAFKSGMPDPSFSGGAASFKTDYGNIATRRKIAISSDGKIAFPTTSPNGQTVSVFRLRPDGTPDTDFNKTGSVGLYLGYGTYDYTSYSLNALAMSHDGNSIIGTGFRYYSDDLLFLRVSTQGVADPSLAWGGGRQGATILSGLGRGIELFTQPTGKILIRTSKHFLVRLNENGTLDESFQFANQTLAGNPEDVLVFPDGTFLVSGTHSIVSNHNELWVSKFDINGNLVSSFGNNGTNLYDPGLDYRIDSSQLLKIDSDKFLLVSSAQRGFYNAPPLCVDYRSECLRSTGSVCGPGQMSSVCVSRSYDYLNGSPTTPSSYSDLTKTYMNEPVYQWLPDYQSPTGALTITYQNNGSPHASPRYLGFSIPSTVYFNGSFVTPTAKLQFAEADSRGRLVLTTTNMSGTSALSSDCFRIMPDGFTRDSSFVFSPQVGFLIEDFRLQPDDQILFLAPTINSGNSTWSSPSWIWRIFR